MFNSRQHIWCHNNLYLSHSRRFKLYLNLNLWSKFSNNLRLHIHSKTQHSISYNLRPQCSFTPKHREGNLSSSQFFSELSILFLSHFHFHDFVSDVFLLVLLFTLSTLVHFLLLHLHFGYLSMYSYSCKCNPPPPKKRRDITPDIFILKNDSRLLAPKDSRVLHWKCSSHFIFLILLYSKMLCPFLFLIRFSDRISLSFPVYKLLFEI